MKNTEACRKDKCKLKCPMCKICVHNYSCSCQDYGIRLTICQHIHYVVDKLFNEEEISTFQEHQMTSQDSSKKRIHDGRKEYFEVWKKVMDGLNKVEDKGLQTYLTNAGMKLLMI